MSEDISGQDLNVERRVFLFQVDLTDPLLNRVVMPRTEADVHAPVKVSDPVDYDDPASSLYWRNIGKLPDVDGKDGYAAELRKKFDIFSTEFLKEIKDGRIKLKVTDVSEFVKALENYGVKLEGMENKATISLGRPDVKPEERPHPGKLQVDFSQGDLENMAPHENNIVYIKVRRGGDGNPWELEFVGMVAKVDKSYLHGKVDGYVLDVYGRSKPMYTTQVISQRSLNPEEMIVDNQLSDPAVPTPLADAFNGFNVKKLFDYIMTTVVASVAPPSDPLNDISVYGMDPKQFTGKTIGFQHNVFVLLAQYLIGITDPNTLGLSPASLEALLNPALPPNVIELPPSGVVERGNQEVFNLMLSTGNSPFYSTMAKPADILGEIRSNAFTDIFESRDGSIVCRPPRYDKIEQTFSETSRLQDPAETLVFDGLSWDFNRDKNFYIKSENMISVDPISKSDMDLESRIDVKVILPFHSGVDFPETQYVDPDILFRYGLKMHAPVNNPNAYNTALGRIFAPIALTMVNANTRSIQATVKDTMKFYIGKLYYLEALDMVGYLVSDLAGQRYSGNSTRVLSFSLVRSVERRPIKEIKKNPYEVLNVAMMYLADFPTDTNLVALKKRVTLRKMDQDGGNGSTAKDYMYTLGLNLLDSLEKNSKVDPKASPNYYVKPGSAGESSGPRLAMFKYLPSIEDLILEVQSDPSLVAAPGPGTNPVSSVANILLAHVDADGFIYRTQGVTNSSFKDDAFVDPIVSINKQANFRYPGIVNNGTPESIPYQWLAGSPEIVAGLLGYVSPSRTAGNIMLNSGYSEIIPFGKVRNAMSALGKAVLESLAGLPDNSLFTKSIPADHNPTFWMRTPFRATSLAKNKDLLAMTQVLADRLAKADLSMKFKRSTSSLAYAVIDMNWDGITQLYRWTGTEFSLFGSNKSPLEYLDLVDTSLGASYHSSSDFRGDMIDRHVGSLKYDAALGFTNSFYRIAKNPDGTITLPYGHLITVSKKGGVTNLTNFFRVSALNSVDKGGKINVDVSGLNFTIVPKEPNVVLTDENTSPAPRVIDAVSILADGGLYFISPFLEPTIERLLDYYIPPLVGGNISLEEAKKQEKTVSAGAIRTNLADRQAGRRINVCPLALVEASGVTVEVKKAMVDAASPSTGRFQEAMKMGGGLKYTPVLGIGSDGKMAISFQSGNEADIFGLSVSHSDVIDFSKIFFPRFN